MIDASFHALIQPPQSCMFSPVQQVWSHMKNVFNKMFRAEVLEMQEQLVEFIARIARDPNKLYNQSFLSAAETEVLKYARLELGIQHEGG